VLHTAKPSIRTPSLPKAHPLTHPASPPPPFPNPYRTLQTPPAHTQPTPTQPKSNQKPKTKTKPNQTNGTLPLPPSLPPSSLTYMLTYYILTLSCATSSTFPDPQITPLTNQPEKQKIARKRKEEEKKRKLEETKNQKLRVANYLKRRSVAGPPPHHNSHFQCYPRLPDCLACLLLPHITGNIGQARQTDRQTDLQGGYGSLPYLHSTARCGEGGKGGSEEGRWGGEGGRPL